MDDPISNTSFRPVRFNASLNLLRYFDDIVEINLLEQCVFERYSTLKNG